MTSQNSKPESGAKTKTNWLHSLAFAVLGLVGYIGFVWLRGNYLDALAMPLVIGFVWLAGMKQKLAWAVAFVALYMMLAVPAMAAGWMDWQKLNPILTGVVLMVVTFTMTRLPLQKSAVLVAFVVLALGLYLFPHWRQEPSS